MILSLEKVEDKKRSKSSLFSFMETSIIFSRFGLSSEFNRIFCSTCRIFDYLSIEFLRNYRCASCYSGVKYKTISGIEDRVFF